MVLTGGTQRLHLRTLFRIARQMLIEVGDGSSKQVLLVVVIRVQARAARIADVLTPLFDLDSNRSRAQ